MTYISRTLLYAVGFQTQVDEADSSKEIFVLDTPNVPVIKAALSMINIFLSSIIAPSHGYSPCETATSDADSQAVIVECSIDKKLAKRGYFDISVEEYNQGTVLVDVRFPSGPVNLLSDVIVGSADVKCAQLKFIPLKGNSSWAVGVVPTAQKHPHAIWDSRLSWFRGGSNVLEITQPLEQAETNGGIVELLVDYSSRKMTLSVAGEVVEIRSVPELNFPLRLGICGHTRTRVKVLAPRTPQKRLYATCLLSSSRFHNRLSKQDCKDAIQSVLGDTL